MPSAAEKVGKVTIKSNITAINAFIAVNMTPMNVIVAVNLKNVTEFTKLLSMFTLPRGISWGFHRPKVCC